MTNQVSECVGCVIKRLCITNCFTDPDISKLSQGAVANHIHQRGTSLSQTAACLNRLTVLKSGSAKTELLSVEGDRQVVAFHFPGDLLGLDSLGQNEIPTSVVFLEKSSTCSLPTRTIALLNEPLSQLYSELVCRLSSEVAITHESILYLNNYTAEQRLAVFLLDLSHRQQKRGLCKNYLNLTMSRIDIGNYLGLASETVSRTMTKFIRQGLIKVKNRQLELCNYPALIMASHYCADCLAAAV